MAERLITKITSPARQPHEAEETDTRTRRLAPSWMSVAIKILAISAAMYLLSSPVAAQTSGTAFCATPMATTIRNVFMLIQFGGPLVGGTIALGAVVATPYVRRVDAKRDLKDIRNQAIIWGLLVAPLATTIVRFLLNDVVAGGASCGF